MESAQATSKAAVAGRRILGYLLLAVLIPVVILAGLVVTVIEVLDAALNRLEHRREDVNWRMR
jgi:hypothetical protein